jgi:hypothetical protein
LGLALAPVLSCSGQPEAAAFRLTVKPDPIPLFIFPIGHGIRVYMAEWTLTVEEGAGLAARLIAVESSATDMDTGESVGVVVFQERTPFPLAISKSGSVAMKQRWSIQLTSFGGVVINPKPERLRFGDPCAANR